MNIQELVRRDYAAAAAATEQKAGECPAGSPERTRWLEVAAIYRQLTADLAAPPAATRWNNPAPVLAVGER